MKPEELKRRLRGIFLDELEEHVRDLERDAVALEKSVGGPAHKELQQRLFRSAHSLKGAARSVGAIDIEGACHRLEQTLEELRQAKQDEYAQHSASLLAHIDRIRAAGKVFEQEVAPHVSVPPPPIPPPRVTVSPPAALHASEPVGAPQASGPQATPSAGAVRTPDARAVRVASEKLDVLLVRASELDEAWREVAMLGPELEELARGCRAIGALLPSENGVQPSREGPRARLIELAEKMERIYERFESQSRLLSRTTEALDDDVRSVRMVPLEAVCEGFDRSVRDLAATLGKQIQLVVSDEQVEVDRSVAQRLREPLLHLVRNAVTHGIEPASDRLAAGKPSHGNVRISARMLGAEVEVSVDDDGRGFDHGALAAEASRLGISYGDDQELLRTAFLPNVSTALQVTEVAGRGVGLDAVKQSVEALRGAIDVDTTPGRGARIALRVPTTLSRMRCLYFQVGPRVFALPLSNVARLVRFEPQRIQVIEGFSRLPLSDGSVVAAEAGALFGLGSSAQQATAAVMQALLVSHQGRRIALIVDALLDEREATVHALPRRALQTDLLTGAISVPGGGLVPLVSGGALVRRALDVPRDARPRAAPERRKVLVVDDSVTTRAVLRSILEDAGYAVTSAENGRAALAVLESGEFELVVSDVQMPELDGIGLTESLRKDPRHARLPVVLVTALAAEADRERGLHAGANAYITKSAFDHRALLDAVRKLLGSGR